MHLYLLSFTLLSFFMTCSLLVHSTVTDQTASAELAEQNITLISCSNRLCHIGKWHYIMKHCFLFMTSTVLTQIWYDPDYKPASLLGHKKCFCWNKVDHCTWRFTLNVLNALPAAPVPLLTPLFISACSHSSRRKWTDLTHSLLFSFNHKHIDYRGPN